MLGRNFSTLQRFSAVRFGYPSVQQCASRRISNSPVARFAAQRKPDAIPHSSSFISRWNGRQLRSYAVDVEPISGRIEKLIKSNAVVIFMKGVPEQPMCGFSNAVVQVLRMHGVENYDAHNVLEDEDLRQGIKDYSDWPTIPQVYFDGEFVGGCDILLQMHQSGDLIEELKKLGITSSLEK